MAVHFLGGLSAQVAAGDSLMLWPHAVKANRDLKELHEGNFRAYMPLSDEHAGCIQDVSRGVLEKLKIPWKNREFVQLFPLSPVLPASLLAEQRAAVREVAELCRQFERSNMSEIWAACERRALSDHVEAKFRE